VNWVNEQLPLIKVRDCIFRTNRAALLPDIQSSFFTLGDSTVRLREDSTRDYLHITNLSKY